MSIFSLFKPKRYDSGASCIDASDWEYELSNLFPSSIIYLADNEYLALDDEKFLSMCRKVIWLPSGGYRKESNDCDNASAIARGAILKYAAENGFKRQPAIAEFAHETHGGEHHMALILRGKSGKMIYFDPQDFTNSYDIGGIVDSGEAVWG